MMPSKDPDRESPAILEEYPGDFLQDPELWVDQLPQPFRMIDDILLGMLENAWDRIEARVVERRMNQARVSIPEVSDASLLSDMEVSVVPRPNCVFAESAQRLSYEAIEVRCCHSVIQGIQAITAGRNGLMFVGSTTGLSVFDANTSRSPQLLARRKEVCVKSIAAGCSGKDMQILAAVLENGNMGNELSSSVSDLMILFFPRGSESVCVH